MRGEISIHFLKEGSAVDEFELRSLSSQMAADRGSAVFKAPNTLHSKLSRKQLFLLADTVLP